ncbi:MAG TPA: class I SAM-dependent methyltransferase [Vicinamibacterales bacterium]|nr:class I SAM-dependent methyltransferase [Vicinamibacterales bacterium]
MRVLCRPKHLMRSVKAAKVLWFDYGHLRSVRAGRPVDAAGQPIPWFTYPAIEFLQQLDFSARTVFEYGSGNSTLFWAGRATCVVSVEDDERWFEQLKTQAPPNCTLLHEPDLRSYVDTISRYPEGFDVIVVDGPARGRTRVNCARAAVQHLKPGGMIILDNSDWLPDSARLLRDADLLQVDMSGFIPIGDHTQTTSIFFHRQSRFGVTGTRQPLPGIGAIHRDWETVTPVDGPWLDWDGERIYGVVRHEVFEKVTPDGSRAFEIAFFDHPAHPPSAARRALLYDCVNARILYGPYVVESTTEAIETELARLRAMSWERFRDFARQSDRRRYLLE